MGARAKRARWFARAKRVRLVARAKRVLWGRVQTFKKFLKNLANVTRHTSPHLPLNVRFEERS